MQSINVGTGEHEARAQIERELEPGERLRWCSRANPSRLARREAVAGLFGIPFLAFSIFWTATATGAGAPGFFTLWGLMFCGIGLWIVSTPLRAKKAAASTFYGVSDRRAIVVEGESSRTVRSWGRRELKSLSRTEHADGTGDVIFDQEERRASKGRRYTVDIGFFGIRDARYVEGLLRDIIG